MTKEQIEERIKLITDQRDQIRANLMLHEGALQDCQYWLDSMSKDQTLTSEEIEKNPNE